MTFNCQWKILAQVDSRQPGSKATGEPDRDVSFSLFDFISQSPLKITHMTMQRKCFCLHEWQSSNCKTPWEFLKIKHKKLSLNQQFYQMNTGIQTKLIHECDIVIYNKNVYLFSPHLWITAPKNLEFFIWGALKDFWNFLMTRACWEENR